MKMRHQLLNHVSYEKFYKKMHNCQKFQSIKHQDCNFFCHLIFGENLIDRYNQVV